MKNSKLFSFINKVLENMPEDWLRLTTHRLDIYDEQKAKVQFLEQLEQLYDNGITDSSELYKLPTAYDYIRLGHPLSSVLEWGIGKKIGLAPEQVISFSSTTMPIMAILRKNSLDQRNTQINYQGDLPPAFNQDILRDVYGYNFELKQLSGVEEIGEFNGSIVFVSHDIDLLNTPKNNKADFYISIHEKLGSVLLMKSEHSHNYISDIQHVRRRETIAMTPADCLILLNRILEQEATSSILSNNDDKKSVENSIKEITDTELKPLIASSGLSIQYAIMMGLIDDAQKNYKGKEIKFLVPTNCYGGTNDQARRVAATIEGVEVLDLEVDGDNDMVQSLDRVLDEVAIADAIPFIIAEIPTNPRVEVPDLTDLKNTLIRKRYSEQGAQAVDPVFVLDQTFCPNVHFLGDGEVLSSVRAIAYVSGSKFPSGGLCTAGFCVANNKMKRVLSAIEKHLVVCDNEATDLQMQILAKQLPSMNDRIQLAYENTRKFVSFIERKLPEAKINFVSEELAIRGFTPSVFSLDLPSKGATTLEKEHHKRELNLNLINLMITEIPEESKFCVSYGQLKGCYWTIPATSTQGTTKEGDKDYIVRVALSGNMDLDRHKEVFAQFVEGIS